MNACPEPKIAIRETHDRQVLRLRLDSPPGNILDRQMMREITDAVREAEDSPRLKAIVFEGSGDHFSYGASIPEHQREIVADLLKTFRELFTALVDLSCATASVVRGQCLGGGLELASFCHWIFADRNSRFGQPEIKLGVFPPIASVILPKRIGQAHADDLIVSGRSVECDEAVRLGLVQSVSSDPDADCVSFLEKTILPSSASSLKHTIRAARLGFSRGFLADLMQLETSYLNELMTTEDANEGINAFLEKRTPSWKHR